MKKKRQASTVLVILAIICLLTIGTILATGIIKNRAGNQKQTKTPSEANVLGEVIEQQMTLAPTTINQFFQEPLQETKEVVSQKITEVEKQIINTVQKEISTLTQSQVEMLKLQICRDLGVITSAPTQ